MDRYCIDWDDSTLPVLKGVMDNRSERKISALLERGGGAISRVR
jgi:hypothetical protein